MGTAHPFWWPSGRGDGQRPVLFFPPSGAEPSTARPLVAPAAGLRFGVVQLPGRGTRYDEDAPTDLTALVAEIADAVRRLDGPAPVLVGHSFGGLLAYGVTSRLADLGVAVARLVVVASADPLAWTAELRADAERHPDDDRSAFVQRRTARILAEGGVPPGVLAHPEFAARARELVSVDVGLSYAGFVPQLIGAPVTSIVAREDRMLRPTHRDGWAELATGPYLRVDVPGDHFFYRSNPRVLMARLRMDVQALDSEHDVR